MGNDAIPKCNTAKLHIKEPADTEKDWDGRRVEAPLVPEPKLSVNHWTSEPQTARDFPGSLAYAIGKPVNISSLGQQQNKGLDTSPGGRLAGNKARGYTKAGTTQPVRRFSKVEYNLQQVASLWLLHY